MPTQIRPTRLEVSDRFPMLGFAIHSDGPDKKCEVAVATDAGLFGLDGRASRTRENFFSSGATGPITVARGEAVYVLPPEVLARFVGQSKLYFALASLAEGNGARADIDVLPSSASPYVSLRSFTGRSLRNIRMLPNRQQIAAGYGRGSKRELEWAGDAVTPGTQPVGNGSAKASVDAPAAATNGGAIASRTAQAAALDYDDGYGPLPAGEEAPVASADDDATHDIGGPIPDGEPTPAGAAALADEAASSEYPQAKRFEAAARSNYRSVSGARTINRIVIHITDGGSKINGTIGWFQNPAAKVSSHYIVGQDGEVVQMVRHNDVAWHAGSANGDSIGIEHVANTRGLVPTQPQYEASAALVRWLCDQFGIAVDRTHILGHAEADTKTTHKGCPNAVWDWDTYMGLVNSLSSEPAASEEDSDGETASAESLSNGAAVRRAAPARTRQFARPLEVVQQDYQPGDAPGALQIQLDFQTRYQQWMAGVPDTSFFPHCAICQLVRDDGGMGTGSYIAPDRILTAAHVVKGANSITVIPGKNGSTEPFGKFTVQASDWQVHPEYDDTRNHDLAVLVVSTPPPGGQFFDILEELRESLPSNIIVCGYSAGSNKYPAVSAAIDPNKQHLDGDYIRTVEDETFEYNLQTLPGASGSPVYYVWVREDDERQQSVLEVHLVGVHVSGMSDKLNQGCRLTDDKISWIYSVSPASVVSQSLGTASRKVVARTGAMGAPGSARPVMRPARAGTAASLSAESFSLNWDEVKQIPQPTCVSCWATAAAMIIGWRDKLPLTPEIISQISQRSLNKGLKPDQVRAFAAEIGLEYEEPQSYSIEGFRNLLESFGPLWIAEFAPFPTGYSGHVVAVTGLYSDGAEDGSDTFVRITDPWDKDPGTPGTPGPTKGTHLTGSRYIMAWSDFVLQYEEIAHFGPVGTIYAQILHSGGTNGREPNRGTPPDYAMATGLRVRLPAPPKARTRALSDAGTIANARIETVTGRANGVQWQLDQLIGFKTPGDRAPVSGAQVVSAAPIRLAGWPFIEGQGGRVAADFEIGWQYDGAALGNVTITTLATQGVPGASLEVVIRLVDDPTLYPPERPSYAALRVLADYRFVRTGADDIRAVVELHLFADGTYEQLSRWVTRAA